MGQASIVGLSTGREDAGRGSGVGWEESAPVFSDTGRARELPVSMGMSSKLTAVVSPQPGVENSTAGRPLNGDMDQLIRDMRERRKVRMSQLQGVRDTLQALR